MKNILTVNLPLHTAKILCQALILRDFLIKFGRTNQTYLVLIASTMFAFSSTVRLTGIILLPIEFFILSIFIINNRSKNKKIISLIYAVVPWVIFLLVFAYGNILTTGEPFVVYGTLNEGYTRFFESSPLSLIAFEETDFENAKQYSKYLLPYIFVGAFNSIDNNFENILGEHWIGLIPIIIISLIFIFSYKSRSKKLEVFVITLFILGIIWIYGSITSEELGELGVPGRYVLPGFVLSSMLFGYAIEQIFSKIRKRKGTKIKLLQLTLVSSLFIIVMISYNFSPAITMLDQNDYFKNPFDYEREFPLDKEGIKENGIIVTGMGSRAQEYDLAAFRLIVINQTPEKIIRVRFKSDKFSSNLAVVVGHVIGNRHRPISLNDDCSVSFPIHDDSEIELFQKLFQDANQHLLKK